MVVQEISRRDGISLPISPMDSINSWHTSPESGSNPGIDRPNARYNSALWLRAASPEKKRNANPMAREGRRVKSGREREEREERDTLQDFPTLDLSPFCAIERRRLHTKGREIAESGFEVALYDIAPLSGLRFRTLLARAGSPPAEGAQPTPLRQIGQFAVIRAGSHGIPS